MTRTTTQTRIFGILPAAGMSRRMGTPKQSLPFEKSTMTAHVASTMLATHLDAVVVVTRTDLVEAIALPTDDRLLVATNDDPSTQMIDSIRIALSRLDRVFSLRETDGLLVIPGDMPTVPPGVFQKCIESFRENPSKIVIATHNGKRGHPMVFPSALSQTIHQMSGGLNRLPLIHTELVREVPVDAFAILRDIDTKTDYDNLRSDTDG